MPRLPRLVSIWTGALVLAGLALAFLLQLLRLER